MGMYDTLTINPTKLPLSEPDRLRLQHANAHFQTKSLERMLATYTITDDGFLEKQDGPWFGDADEPEARRTHAGPQMRLVDAHGVVFFYTSVDGEWFEFEARFTEGQLSRLTRVEAQWVSRDQTCVWGYELPVADLVAAGY